MPVFTMQDAMNSVENALKRRSKRTSQPLGGYLWDELPNALKSRVAGTELDCSNIENDTKAKMTFYDITQKLSHAERTYM